MRAALLLALFLAPAAPAQAESPPPGMLPPEIARQFDQSILEGFNERPLWRGEARRGYRSRIRFTIAGIHYTRISIRIDERRNGRVSGHIAIYRRRDRIPLEDLVTHGFRVSRDEFEGLQREIESSRLWDIYPQFWNFTNPGDLCIDGMELVFERLDERGYRFSTANAQCTAPQDMKRVAEAIIEIAGVPHVRNWLY